MGMLRTLARVSLTLAALAAAASLGASPGPETVFLFSYFTGNGEDGLHLAWSEDGLQWTALREGESCLDPTVGKDRLMRDPSIVQGPDGRFHMVWTSSWTDRIIGYAHSTDLIEWSPQRAIPVMMHEPKARNSWAPELFFDRASEEFWIIWSTTIPGRFPSTAGSSESDYNHRIYSTSTRDFVSFTPTRLFFDPGYNVIDGFLATHGKRYLLFYKDERKLPEAKKEILLATSDRLIGPWEAPREPISPRNWVEGPSVVQIDGDWLVYFDAYTRHRYEAVRSKDLVSWTDITHRIRFPEGARHGTVLRVSRTVWDRLVAHFDDEAKSGR
jgi:beta-xylosidase